MDLSRKHGENLVDDQCGVIERLIKFLHVRILDCARISIRRCVWREAVGRVLASAKTGFDFNCFLEEQPKKVCFLDVTVPVNQKSLQRLLGGLLANETRLGVEPFPLRGPREPQVVLGLREPIARSGRRRHSRENCSMQAATAGAARERGDRARRRLRWLLIEPGREAPPESSDNRGILGLDGPFASEECDDPSGG